MNLSIVNVSRLQSNPVAAHYAFVLLANAKKKIKVTFKKKDGSLREMVCIPKQSYNDLVGRESTDIGRKIVASKSKRGMIVVSEIVTEQNGSVTFQPRTINLATLVSMEEV